MLLLLSNEGLTTAPWGPWELPFLPQSLRFPAGSAAAAKLGAYAAILHEVYMMSPCL